MILYGITWLLWRSHVERLHNQIVSALTKSAFTASDINPRTRTVHMGFYSLKSVFLDNKDGFLLWLLHWFYGYKFTETRMEFPQFMKPVNKVYRQESCDATCLLKHLPEADGRVPCCKTWAEPKESTQVV